MSDSAAGATPDVWTDCEMGCWKAVPWKGTWGGGPGPWQVGPEPAVPWRTGEPTLSWGASGTALQPGKGGHCPAPLSTGAVSPQALRALLSATTKRTLNY